MDLQSDGAGVLGPGTWLELNAGRLRANLAAVKALAGTAKIMAVVKANAYGAGAQGVARQLAAAGVAAFGAGSVAEGASLRASGIRGDICCLTFFTQQDVETILEYGLSTTLFTMRDAEALAARAAAAGRTVRAWIKVDTGLGRLGVPWSQAAAFVAQACRLPGLAILGLLSTLTENPARDREQVRRLLAVRAQAPQAAHLQLSLASSHGLLSLPDGYLDMVRPGIMLLGWAPSEPARLDAGLLRRAALQNVVTWKTRVLYIKTVERGEQVGYGRQPALQQPLRVATLATGWSVGYPATMSRGGQALLRGARCPVLAVSANTTLVDATAAPEAAINDEAVLLGQQGGEEIGGQEMADASGTSVYRLLAGIPADVERAWL